MMAEVPPTSRREAVITVAALVIAASFGLALFGGWIPGLKPNYTVPSTVTVEGHAYYWTDYSLTFPPPLLNYTVPSSMTFHNVTFQVWVTGWYQPVSGYVRGNATEPNATTFSFVLGGPADVPGRQTLFLSPDHELGAAWNGQAFVELLVLAPGGP